MEPLLSTKTLLLSALDCVKCCSYKTCPVLEVAYGDIWFLGVLFESVWKCCLHLPASFKRVGAMWSLTSCGKRKSCHHFWLAYTLGYSRNEEPQCIQTPEQRTSSLIITWIANFDIAECLRGNCNKVQEVAAGLVFLVTSVLKKS